MSWASIAMSSAATGQGPAALTFEKETVSGRVWSSVVRGSVLQFLILLSVSVLQSIWLVGGPLHPWNWLTYNLNVFFHPSSWFFDTLIATSIVAMGIIYARGYRLTSASFGPGSPWLLVLRDLLRPEVVVSALAHVGAGLVLARSYLGLVGHHKYSGLTLLCAELGQDRCINEPHVTVVVSGGFTGFALWLEAHRVGSVLHFRAIDQRGVDHVRGEFGRMCREAVTQVLLNLRWFYLAYLLLGGRLERFLGDVLHMDLYSYGTEPSVSQTLWKHVGTVTQCLVIDTLIHLSLRILHMVVNLSLTRRVKFAMRSVAFVAPSSSASDSGSSEDLSSVALLDAMEPKNSHHLMKYLAYQDFACLAENSALRRADFYTLSQPGGHPRNWGEVVTKCLGLIKEFSKDLNEASKQAVTVIPSSADLAKKGSVVMGDGGGGHKALQSDGLRQRAMAVPSSTSLGAALNGPNKTDNKGSGLLASLTLASSFKAVSDKLISMVKGRVPFLTTSSTVPSASSSSSPDVAVRAVYAGAMPVIWAIKGMSHLIVNSISEDRFGVVQKDLANILVELLSLLQTLERHKGLTATARKNRFETRDLQLKQDLRVTLKSSLYRITVTFGESLNSLDLPNEHKARLANYQSFKEG